jgi:cyclophilin family peptidyl-prolyl cis-trans isomerase
MAAVVTLASLTACSLGNKSADSSSSTKAEGDTEVTTEATDTSSTSVYSAVTELPQLDGVKVGDTIATIHTNMGDIKVWFFPKYAPKAVENFTTHAKEGYYDNVIFHRVINNFMIQGGDPLGTGTGGESIWGKDFENEVSFNLRSFRGALCMANSGGTSSNGSQFYIVQNPDVGDQLRSQLEELEKTPDEVVYDDGSVQLTSAEVFPKSVIDEYSNNGGYPTLDMGYTIFGQVYEGMDVVDKIAAVETDSSDKPTTDVVIKSIEVGTYQGK